MVVLGINGVNGTYHDSAACLIDEDGEWSAVEEERLNRAKHTSGFPVRSIEWCLKERGVSTRALEGVGFYLDTDVHFARYFLKTVHDHPGGSDDFFLSSYKLMRYWQLRLRADMARSLGVDAGRLTMVPHHLAHAASAYYPSSFEEAAVLVVDGVGDAESASYFVARGTRIERLATPLVFPASLGLVYGFVASHLGLGAVGGAGKLMGLAPYGRPTLIDFLRRVVRVPDEAAPNARIAFDLRYFGYHLGGGNPAFSPAFLDVVGPPRRFDEPLLQRHADLAASMQLLLEDAMVFLARQLRAVSGLDSLCYAGGVALNIDANTRIRKESGFREVFVMPSAYDAGTSIGAAMHVHHAVLGRRRVRPMKDAFKGPVFDEAEIREAFRAKGLEPLKSDDVVGVAAGLLARGAILGWFQGREEIGPRALGNRSILMDPSLPDGTERINARVKFREAFRPFAPSVALDEAGRYFEDPWPSPHMLYAFRVRPEWRRRLPSVTHVDGSARVHTVAADENPLFHSLLKAFGRKTGYSVLLNTSLNVQGQPLVGTPEQAIELYLRTALDALFLGPYMVSRPARAESGPAVSRQPLPVGVVDPGGAPPFERFETPAAIADQPIGTGLTPAERAILEEHLARARTAASADSTRGRSLRALADWIDRAETDLLVQRGMGSDGLASLWRAWAELFCPATELDVALTAQVRDPFLPFAFDAEGRAVVGRASSQAPTASSSVVAGPGELRTQIESLIKELGRQQSQAESLQREIDLRDRMLRELQTQANELQATIAEMQSRLNATQQQVTLRDQLLQDQQARLQATQGEVNLRDGMLQRQQVEASEMLQRSQAQAGALQAEINVRDELLKGNQARADALAGQLQDGINLRDEMLQRLQAQANALQAEINLRDEMLQRLQAQANALQAEVDRR